MSWDVLWLDANIATMQDSEDGLSIIERGAIAIKDGFIAWIGPQSELPKPPDQCARKIYSANNKWITPGLIDCHTHLVYAGNRADEFKRRLEGESYAEIAQSGGGIQSTVAKTRAASEETLYQESLGRLLALIQSGVTTVEIKSGYGLTFEDECKMLRVARRFAEQLPITVKTTFLAAHALPKEYDGNADQYIDDICQVMIPQLAKLNLADAIDAFCETIAFTPEQIERVFSAAKKYDFPVKCHAEQLTDQSGAKLAADYNALSADHLEFVSEKSIKQMAQSKTVAVLLPGAYYYLRETQKPPVDLFRKHHVPIAIATDCNPGSSPCTSLLLMLNMACTLFDLTPQEALAGVTINAAKALGVHKQRGSLEVGKVADFAVWDVSSPEELCYRFGFNPLIHLVKGDKMMNDICIRTDASRTITAPTGSTLSCKNWQAEAALRMLMNNLDPMVAENPSELVVYGGIGRAARNWPCFDKIVETLRNLELDETLLVQSGKPVGVFKTHSDAPRVIIANSNLVPHWANWETFNELDKKGLMMYGQMTAGSWIYIGSQGIIQGTYETFVEAGRQHYNGDLSGKWILTAGLGGMGGAQTLAATMAGACMLAIECDPAHIQKRLDTRYLDRSTDSLDEALQWIDEACAEKQAISVGLLGNAAEILPELIERGVRPDIVTDQTSAHDPLNGYLPIGWTLEQAAKERKANPQKVIDAARASMAEHVKAMLAFHGQGIPTVDYGNNIRQVAFDEGVENAFDFPGFVPAYIRPLFCEGIGPFRWVALSGDPEDIYKTDQKLKELIPDNKALHNWLDMAKQKIAFQGLPSRICWIGLGDRDRVGLAFNEMVASGELKGPIVIGRDHLDSGSVASPNRETESMKDGSDAVSDWPMLNAMLNCAGGATWVSLHHGGGVGMGFSQHAGFVIVCDGTQEASKRLERVLYNDPGTGVMRHADAGYDIAKQCAKENGLNLPMEEDLCEITS